MIFTKDISSNFGDGKVELIGRYNQSFYKLKSSENDQKSVCWGAIAPQPPLWRRACRCVQLLTKVYLVI